MRRLRVLHINNTAGVAGVLSLAQREHGMQAIVMTDYPSIYGFKEDVLLRGNGVAQLLTMLYYIRWADVVHVHAGLPGRTKKRLFPLFSKGKCVVQHFHGTDLRVLLGGYEGDCIVATPDLLDRAPKGTWIGSAVGHEFFSDEDSPPERVKKVVGMRVFSTYGPTHEVGVSVHKALMELRNERKDFEILVAAEIKHSEMVNFYRKCGVVIDQKPVGWFGLLGAEAMAMGRPVIADVRADLQDKFKPRVMRTDGTVESTIKCLNALLDSPERASQLGREGREYALREFHPDAMQRKVMDFYLMMQAVEVQ